MPRLAIALLALTLAACGDGAPEPPVATPDSETMSALARADSLPGPSAAADSVARTERQKRAEAASRSTMPFERSAMVFDTTEPPPVRVQIQPRPRPAPAPPPAPRPAPPTPAPRPPEPPATSGSCDVRETESFCFAYTGAGWSRRAATAHCRDAPDSSYRPAVCPAEDAIATCRFTRDGAPTLEIVYTYYAPYDLMLAQLACPGEFERIETGR